MTPDLRAEALKRREELEARVRADGKDQTATYDGLYGAGVGLWESAEEFDRFLATVRATRAEEG